LDSQKSITLVIPYFNNSSYINYWISNIKVILSSKITEIIIVDDFSSLEERLKLKDAFRQFNSNQFKLICHDKNYGPFHSRYTGLLNSINEFVLFIDFDDEISLNILDDCEYSSFDVYTFSMSKIYFDGQVKKILYKDNFSLENLLLSGSMCGRIFKKQSILSCFKEFIIENPYLRFAEDVSFMYFLVSSNLLWHWSNKVLIHHYKRQNSITTSQIYNHNQTNIPILRSIHIALQKLNSLYFSNSIRVKRILEFYLNVLLSKKSFIQNNLSFENIKLIIRLNPILILKKKTIYLLLRVFKFQYFSIK
jgi:hypothetical protein